jgi:hypothetical protein
MATKNCEKCQNEFPTYFKINGKLRNLCKRKFCLDCSPFGSHNTKNISKSENYVSEINGIKYKKCPCCERFLELNSENYYIRSSTTFHYYCKLCLNKKSIDKKRELKKKAVEYKGGKCIKCGYNRYVGALDFHHLNPSEKDFHITSFKTYDWEKIKCELDKCELVCSNCHREIHGLVS